MLKAQKKNCAKWNIRVEKEVRAETKINVEVEVVLVVVEVKEKVLIAARAKMNIIIITNGNQNEVIYLPMKNVQRNRNVAAQAIRGRKSDVDLEAKTLLVQKNS